MKVVQLLLDGYNNTNKISNIYSSNLLSGFKCRTMSTLLKGDRLASPNMWGRTLYGSNFSQGKHNGKWLSLIKNIRDMRLFSVMIMSR